MTKISYIIKNKHGEIRCSKKEYKRVKQAMDSGELKETDTLIAFIGVIKGWNKKGDK